MGKSLHAGYSAKFKNGTTVKLNEKKEMKYQMNGN